MRHRGLLFEEVEAFQGCALGANRLPIIDSIAGQQPAANENGTVYAVLNGEIFNWQDLSIALRSRGHRLRSSCDTETLVHLWEDYGTDIAAHLDGMFAFVVYDLVRHTVCAARDHVGIKPLYFMRKDGAWLFGSEIKAFAGEDMTKLQELPPGHFFLNGSVGRYHYPAQHMPCDFRTACGEVRERLGAAVEKTCRTKLPLAVFFSGGVDSSLVLRLAAESHNDVTAITVGFEDSPDLSIARRFCDEVAIPHIVFIIDDAMVAQHMHTILYHLESFNPNLVRGGIFTFFAAQAARAAGFRVALSGEGSDEIFAGYADFSRLSGHDIRALCKGLFEDLHRTQLLRLDRCTMAHAVETRVPFMDPDVTSYAMSVPPEYKVNRSCGRTTCKHVLREAFRGFLPDYIVDRPKVPMDEGAVIGGRSALDAKLSCIAQNLWESIDGELLAPNGGYEGAYYEQFFIGQGFDNPLSRRRATVRGF
jgi:asparagine synthase (glutamine-hydrolysing)